MLKSTLFALSVAFVAVFSSATYEEQKQTLGNWDVHYSAFTSTFLAPKVAATYGITRSASKGVLNISVLDKNTQAPQELEVTGQVVNPLGQIQSLEFQKITEAEAVYYITQFDYTNAETLRFTINIGDEQTLKFNQEFWLND